MNSLARFTMGLALLAVAAGCSRDETMVAPQSTSAITGGAYTNKNGTEALGTPSITLAAGSGFAEGGVGMVGVASNTLDITVPAGATVVQVLAYWSGAATSATGDDTIGIDGNDVTGTLIGGPTWFYSTAGKQYFFSAYRADITDLALVAAGANSVSITGFDFPHADGPVDENNGVSLLVIYDDGSEADLALVDGLDLAFFQFAAPLDATAPQTFTFSAEPAAREAQLIVMAGSVGENRPNEIKVTTSAGDQFFTDALSSSDGPQWDSLALTVDVPAGATSLTVELISTASFDPLGASLSWLASGLSVPRTPEPEPASLGDFVWIDSSKDGIQDEGEPGLPGVTVHLMDCAGGVLAETTTDAAGFYLFDNLVAGDYNVHFVLPEGYVFTVQDAGDDALDSDADPATGLTVCTTLEPGENDLTWDAGMHLREEFGCSLTIGFWKTHAGFGPQADVVTPLLPLWLGDAGGAQSIEVTTAAQAVSLLTMKDYGGGSNGFAKLYAQLLGTKLNLANGASDDAVADAIIAADALLAAYGSDDWRTITRAQRKTVLDLMTTFDDYNNGGIGPGHCD